MHRLMVESAAYRQASVIRKDLLERDPNNRLLARQSRLRLPAELIRDSALAVGGILNPEIGGKSVFPPQPASVGELAYRNQWKESTGTDLYRRGMYIFRKRTMPYPQLAVFDSPDSLTPCTRRERSTTPLQALNLLNDAVFLEAARGLATRILRDGPIPAEDRIAYGFQLAVGRSPSSREKQRLLRYYEQERARIGEQRDPVEKLYPARGVPGVDPLDGAAWTSVSTVLMNLDEFITRN
jgi:hypothetical protein